MVFAICLFLVLLSGSVSAEISTSVDRIRLAEGETLTLTLEAQGRVAGQPDTQPLEKDFEVLGTASGSRTTITNGDMDTRTTWTISLQAKHSGKITIPPLETGGQKSKAISVEVTKALQADAGSGADIFIETEADPESPYVQGEIRYTVRIYHSVRLLEAGLSELKIENALVRKLKSDREYVQNVNGRPYRVVEQNYVIFPQSSGELVIPAAVLKARVRQGQRSRSAGDPFNMFSASRSISVRSKPHTLQIRPRPAENKGANWLPAKQLSLSEQWDVPQDKIRVGEPITRTLELSAEGLTAAQLPDLNVSGIDGVNSYPDQAQNITLDTGNGVVGEKTRRIAFVPTRPGVFTVPELEVFWWDTKKDQQQRAELPARSFTILPAAGVPAAAVNPVVESAIEPPAAKQTVTRISSATTPGYWPWIALVLAMLWLATLALWLRERIAPSRLEINKSNPQPRADTGSAQKEFKAACRANNPQAARTNLLNWAAIHWPDNPPHGLGDLAGRLEQVSAQQALLELDRVLYRGEDESWNGAALAMAIKKLPQKPVKTSASGSLPPLYPEEPGR